MKSLEKMSRDYQVIFVDAYGVFNFGQGVSKSVTDVFSRWI